MYLNSCCCWTCSDSFRYFVLPAGSHREASSPLGTMVAFQVIITVAQTFESRPVIKIATHLSAEAHILMSGNL